MAALDFPNSPTNGDTFTSPNGGAVYTWDGTKWLTSSVASNTSSQNNVGRNLIHNALFNVQQRGAGPFSVNGALTADRWTLLLALDTSTVNAVALTDTLRGAIGDEAASYALQTSVAGNAGAGAFTLVGQKTEDVRRLAGKTVILSFWAWAASGTPKLGASVDQQFGTGGSPSTAVLGTGQSVTLSTTAARYSLTFAVPSIVGKTVGTNGDSCTTANFWYSAGTTSASRSGSVGVQSGTINLWGVQLEVGSTATTLAKMDPEQDLARCQRYFVNLANVTFPCGSVAGTAYSTSMLWPVTMRAGPTVALSGFTYGGASAAALGGANVAGFYLTATSTGGAGTFAGGNITATADL